MTAVGILLAAGRSERFGRDDKLLAPLSGRPLVAHAAAALVAAGCGRCLAVTSSSAVAGVLTGFEILRLDDQSALQSDSLRAGVRRAQELGADRALVALGDMPFVSQTLLQRVLRRCPEGGVVAATDGSRRLPPACFSADLFPAVLDLRGDRGARSLLKDVPLEACVRVSAGELVDIDTGSDLESAGGAGKVPL